MKTLLNAIAAFGLLVTGATVTVAAAPATAEAQSRYDGRDWRDGRRYDRRDDRRWRNERRWRDERRDRGWRGDRGRGPVVRERIIDPRSPEARAMGVEYRGGCRYVIRNGRRVCG